jgi:acyl-CoA synthetase (AMP-forming)/AMP-acid ligase II
MVISGGENIYPAELENLLATCPGVAEAAAFGVADPQWGESLAAAVVRQPGSALDAEQLRQWLDGRIARYKWPRRFIFVEALPRTALGKVIKDDLQRLVFGNS